MGRTLYVYYRIDASSLDDVVATVLAMQARLRRDHPGLQAGLLRRPGDHDGQVTLMETYAAPQGVDAALQACIDAAAAALARWQRGARHTEVFEPLA